MMEFKEKTLDLTGLNRATFFGKIRVRHILDWANDYYEKGYRLARVKFNKEDYHKFMEELRTDQMYLNMNKFTESLTLDAGFGPIEIVKP